MAVRIRTMGCLTSIILSIILTVVLNLLLRGCSGGAPSW
jgi:TctA family transporter